MAQTNLFLRLSEELKGKIEKAAQEEEQPVSALIRRVLFEWLKQRADGAKTP